MNFNITLNGIVTNLSPPTKERSCWLAFDGTYSGHGETADDAIANMEYWRDRHLRGMAAEGENKDIPKAIKE